MIIDVVSIFPEYLAPLDLSLIGKARRDGLLDLRVHDLRDFAHDRHRSVDDTPYGGGAGMVMKPQPWAEALDHVVASAAEGGRPRVVVPGPGGMPFTQALARELAAEPWLAFACGRYEGIDERVYEYAAEDLGLEVSVISLGDYVLNGGEVAVLAMVEAVARLLPGVIGNAESLVEESHEDGLLEYPVYTKPASWESPPGRPRGPPVLLSGDHGAIAAWRHQQRLDRTAARRPDLLHASQAVLARDSTASPSPSRPCRRPGADGAHPGLLGRRDRPLRHVRRRGGDARRGRRRSRRVAHLDVALRRTAGRLGPRTLHPDEATTWQIGRLMVAPDLQGRGLGRALLAFAEAQAPSGTAAYWLNTGSGSERNLRIYRKAGYRVQPGEGAFPGTVDLVKPRR